MNFEPLILQVEQLVRSRRSIRAYKPGPVDLDKVNKLLDIMRHVQNRWKFTKLAILGCSHSTKGFIVCCCQLTVIRSKRWHNL